MRNQRTTTTRTRIEIHRLYFDFLTKAASAYQQEDILYEISKYQYDALRELALNLRSDDKFRKDYPHLLGFASDLIRKRLSRRNLKSQVPLAVKLVQLGLEIHDKIINASQ